MPISLTAIFDRIRPLFEDLRRRLVARRPTPIESPTTGPRVYRRLERVILTSGVVETLFADFARHRETARGEEEFGWALLGVRDEKEAMVLAALPAGAQRHASLTHIEFDVNVQAAATRILRQSDKRLAMLGVAHTHPGSLRHPSGGDYRGDIVFVTRLRGREGVFAIGTADVRDSETADHPHRQVRPPLGFSWYALAEGDAGYRKLSAQIVEGADLARAFAPLWPTFDLHAESLERLFQQLARWRVEVADDSLTLSIPLPEENRRLRALIAGREIRYYVEGPGGVATVDPSARNLEHGIYAILAELARSRSPGV